MCRWSVFEPDKPALAYQEQLFTDYEWDNNEVAIIIEKGTPQQHDDGIDIILADLEAVDRR